MLIGIALGFIYFHFFHTADVAPQFDQASKLIKQDVTDDARKRQALEIVKQMKDIAEASAKQGKKLDDSLRDLLANRQTPDAQIQVVTNAMAEEDTATAEKLLDLRFQLKSVLTEEEWGEVFPAPTTAPSTLPN